jgi:lipopolysaccharide export system protein LptA
MKLQAASIVAQLNKNSKLVPLLLLVRPAKFRNKLIRQRVLLVGSTKIIYNAETGIINLIGKCLFISRWSKYSWQFIKYSMNKGDIEASGSSNSTGSAKGRVQIIIPPIAKSFWSA